MKKTLLAIFSLAALFFVSCGGDAGPGPSLDPEPSTTPVAEISTFEVTDVTYQSCLLNWTLSEDAAEASEVVVTFFDAALGEDKSVSIKVAADALQYPLTGLESEHTYKVMVQVDGGKVVKDEIVNTHSAVFDFKHLELVKKLARSATYKVVFTGNPEGATFEVKAYDKLLASRGENLFPQGSVDLASDPTFTVAVVHTDDYSMDDSLDSSSEGGKDYVVEYTVNGVSKTTEFRGRKVTELTDEEIIQDEYFFIYRIEPREGNDWWKLFVDFQIEDVDRTINLDFEYIRGYDSDNNLVFDYVPGPIDPIEQLGPGYTNETISFCPSPEGVHTLGYNGAAKGGTGVPITINEGFTHTDAVKLVVKLGNKEFTN